MGTFYDAPNDYRNYLAHHGVKGMHWGVRKQYPIIGRPNGGAYRISRNPLMSALQMTNMRRNQAKDKKETAVFDSKNKDLVAKRDKLREDHFNYINNKLKSYGKDKKLTASINKWIDNRAKYFESRTGKSGDDIRSMMRDSFSSGNTSNDNDGSRDYMTEYLVDNDRVFRDLNAQMLETEREYRNRRYSTGKRPAGGIIY